MKKTILKLILPMLALSLAFSSCLGDSDSNEEVSGVLAYIKGDGDGKYALVTNGRAVTSSAIRSNLETKTFYKISYKFNYSNQKPNGAYEADYADVSGDKDQYSTKTILQYGSPADKNDAVLKLGTTLQDVVKNFDNKWIFDYEANLKKGEVLDVYFFYDKGNQTDKPEEGSEIGEAINVKTNQAIIDVRFEKRMVGVGDDKPAKLTAGNIVVDMGILRYRTYELFAEKENSIKINGEILLPIKLRFLKTDAEGKESKMEYQGQWGENPAYAMMNIKED